MSNSIPPISPILPVTRVLATERVNAATDRMQPGNPLHGLTLEAILTQLVEHYGWPGLAERISIRCFTSDPSIASSLKFLRKTPWARERVEGLFLFMQREAKRAAIAARR